MDTGFWLSAWVHNIHVPYCEHHTAASGIGYHDTRCEWHPLDRILPRMVLSDSNPSCSRRTFRLGNLGGPVPWKTMAECGSARLEMDDRGIVPSSWYAFPLCSDLRINEWDRGPNVGDTAHIESSRRVSCLSFFDHTLQCLRCLHAFLRREGGPYGALRGWIL